MLEQLIRVIFISILLVFFIAFCIKQINGSIENSIILLKFMGGGGGTFRVCRPALIDNEPGRVCDGS